MTTLFEPFVAGDLRLHNRIVMAPLTRNRAAGAVPGDLAVTYYAQRATAGLIISEATAISQQGQGYSDVPGLYEAEQLAGWRRVTDAVHSEGGKIVAQLWHVGRISHVDLQPGGASPVGPSANAARSKTVLVRDGVPTYVDTSPPRPLKVAEISGVIASYASAARKAVEVAGFDGVEIHAANGYLLDQFLKDGINQRQDQYGGSIPNRARLMLETTRAVVDAIGGGRTGIRLSPVTTSNDSFDSRPQPVYEHVVEDLAALDLAYVHVIEGDTGRARQLPDRPFDFGALRAAYRRAGGAGAWMVNNGYDRSLAEQALRDGADLVAFGRPFIANPDLVQRLLTGAALNTGDTTTYYGGGAKGYIDYPFLDASTRVPSEA